MKWQRSTSCKADSPMCVEVYGLVPFSEFISIRDSKTPHKVVSFTLDEWEVFIQGVKKGEFDLP